MIGRRRITMKPAGIAAALLLLLLLMAGALAPRANAAPSPAPTPGQTVKFYVVKKAGADGKPEFLYEIAQKTLGNGDRSSEIFALTKGRLQPDGGRLTNPAQIEAGWVLILPNDAQGPDVQTGKLPGTTARQPETAPTQPLGQPRVRAVKKVPFLSPKLVIGALAGFGLIIIITVILLVKRAPGRGESDRDEELDEETPQRRRNRTDDAPVDPWKDAEAGEEEDTPKRRRKSKKKESRKEQDEDDPLFADERSKRRRKRRSEADPDEEETGFGSIAASIREEETQQFGVSGSADGSVPVGLSGGAAPVGLAGGFAQGEDATRSGPDAGHPGDQPVFRRLDEEPAFARPAEQRAAQYASASGTYQAPMMPPEPPGAEPFQDTSPDIVMRDVMPGYGGGVPVTAPQGLPVDPGGQMYRTAGAPGELVHQVGFGDDLVTLRIASPSRSEATAWRPLPHDAPAGLAVVCVGAAPEGCLFLDLGVAPSTIGIEGPMEAVERLAEAFVFQLAGDTGRATVALVGDALGGVTDGPGIRRIGNLGALAMGQDESDVVIAILPAGRETEALPQRGPRVVQVKLGSAMNAAWILNIAPERGARAWQGSGEGVGGDAWRAGR